MLRPARLIFLALILAPGAAGAADPGAFATFFSDHTMRVDYYHTGDAWHETIALDRVWQQGSWAGSTAHLVDTFRRGRYAVKVYDPDSHAVIFSRGFDSMFGEYRTTREASQGIPRTFSESVLIPFPLRPVRLVIEARARNNSMYEVFSATIDPRDPMISREPPSGTVTVLPVLHGGDPHDMVDLAILGEGYTANQLDLFKRDLARAVDIIFSKEPYASLRDHFNVSGVLRASQEGGCDEPGRGVWRATALGTSFDSFGSERYLLTEANLRMRDIAAHVPYDAIIIMVNHDRYGGGGIYNLYCTFTAHNQWTPYLLSHELGHSFTGLADEYYTSSVAYNEFYPQGIEPVEPNITALLDPPHVKWQALVTPGTPLPTPWEKAAFDSMDLAYQKVREELNAKIAERQRSGAPAEEVQALKDEGERLSRTHAEKVDAYLAASHWVNVTGAFEGAGYASEGLYRPMLDCIMFSKGDKPFCSVCQRAIAAMIASYGS